MILIKFNGWIKHIVNVITVVALILAFAHFFHPISVNAATKYPVLSGEVKGLTAKLNGRYAFQYVGETYPTSYDGEQYAVIKYRNKDGSETTKARIRLKGFRVMRCVGKYKDKFYFNLEDIGANTGSKFVYTYKLGDNRFRKLPNSKGICFSYFRKSDADKGFEKYNGIISGRYVVAKPYNSTFATTGEIAYIYDLKKNKKQKLGRVYDYVVKGKKRPRIYWVTTNNTLFNKSTKILVKSSSASGKNIKIRKSYKAEFLANSIISGYGHITKKYVSWGYTVQGKNGESVNRTWKRKY